MNVNSRQTSGVETDNQNNLVLCSVCSPASSGLRVCEESWGRPWQGSWTSWWGHAPGRLCTSRTSTSSCPSAPRCGTCRRPTFQRFPESEEDDKWGGVGRGVADLKIFSNNSSNETESLCIQLLTLYCFQFWTPSAICEWYFWISGEELVFPKSKRQSNGWIVD